MMQKRTESSTVAFSLQATNTNPLSGVDVACEQSASLFPYNPTHVNIRLFLSDLEIV